MPLFAELKRRNVFKVGAAYLALAWLVLQLTSIVVPAFELPDWTLKFVIWLGVIGFPCALVFAWIYELTPEGLKRDSEVDPGKSITHVTGKRLDYAIVVLLVLAIGMAALQYFRPPTAPPVATSDATVTPTAPAAEFAAPVPTAPAPEPAAVAPDDKSIAVLPFADMSQAKDQEYFSDGMSEELLNLLAKAPDVKVIARTSSFAFKGANTPIAEIARQLHVAHVLEGSVRKSGNTVRITAQLIRTADSTHLWSETYDRPLDDIFKVQDEIASAIVQALQIRMAGGSLSRREGGTQNLEAHQLYLRGVNRMNSNTKASLDAAQDYLEQAVALDPDYGQAWAKLAYLMTLKMDSGFLAMIEGVERSKQLAERALQLSPNLAEAHGLLQYIYKTYYWDWEAAEAEGHRALAIDSTDPFALQSAGDFFIARGNWREAERLLRLALIRDPLNTITTIELGQTYYLAGRFADAEAIFRRLLELESGLTWTRRWLAKTLLAQGRPDEALAMVRLDSDEQNRLAVLSIMLQASGHKEEADSAMQSLISQWAEKNPNFVAMAYAYRGEPDEALEWLEKAYNLRDAGLTVIVGEPLFKSIAHDPRFIAFLKKLNLPTEPVPVNWQ